MNTITTPPPSTSNFIIRIYKRVKELFKWLITYLASKYKIIDFCYKFENIMIMDSLYRSIPHNISSRDCLWKLLKEYEFKRILDVGAGSGVHSKIFYENNKDVTAISAYDIESFDKTLAQKIELIKGDYLQCSFTQPFECIWAAHILEHQRNIGLFLDKIYTDLTGNGIFAVTVPPYEMRVGGGHITCFTIEHLIGHLLEAGFDLTDMRVKLYRGNLSIICKKNVQFKIDKNNWVSLLLSHKLRLPNYLIEAIEKYRKKHPYISSNGLFEGGYHERIPFSTKYKWYT